MALEASGATVVPVGTGQSRRLLELIPRLGITAIFGTLSFPAYLAARAREARPGPARARPPPHRHRGRAGRRPRSRCAPRSRRAWGATVADTLRDERRLVDDGGRVRPGRGPAPDRRRARAARAGGPRERRAARARGRRERRARVDPPAAARPRRCCATARATSADVWTAPCACGRSYAADPHRRPPRRHAARAGGERLPAGDRRDPRSGVGLGRHCVVADGDPVVPPLRVYVEAPADLRSRPGSASASTPRCAPASGHAARAGSLPVAEHKTRIVHRTARGDTLPDAVETLLKKEPAQ